ncbi:DUF2922 domain-containing protein [Romboutsia ilealis]|uniref:DUF2922 domain-containing protein n=1 Tax=Romboutsia faecis TaxID=2764597 RepID=A0ABR7JLM7_9FIRM|nr:DUF2922 domain-containing protein [Romboutsia faecis]MBC5995823.1 DUF2922 domain-containing protein [Romboutsia faecis]MRN23022.1 DUF2922 domain-containing protein [Romboutsia ilealis]
METSLKLVMTFKSEGDKTVNLTIDDPRDDISETEVISAMNLILDKNIFSPDNVDLKEAVKAKVIQTETTEFDLKA